MIKEQELNTLIELCKAGEKKAQQSIFDLYKDELFSICNRYALSYSDAEDMFIEGFTQIFKKISLFSNGNFRSWVKRIMINTCINSYHKEIRRRENEILVEEYSENVEIESKYKFSYEELQCCLQQLKDQQRIIFNMYAIDGYKSKEIAEILKINESSVRVEIHRSKLKLKDLLTQIEQNRKR